MAITIKQHVVDLEDKIAEIAAQQEILKDEIAKVDPLRKELLALELKKDTLAAARANLLNLVEKTPEEEAALNPVDPFGLDED